MVLLGNYSVLNKSCGRSFAGSTSQNRSNWNTPGSVRNMWVGQAGMNRAYGVPIGYNPEYSIYDPPSSGGIASRGFVLGVGGVTAGNLAGGRNAEADLSGTGDITDAACGLIVSAVAALAGSGDITADMLATLQAVAALAGSGDLTAALGALAGLAADLTGSGDAEADASALASLSCDIDVTGDLLTTANVGDSVWQYLAEGNYSAADILRILAAVMAGKTNIDGTTVSFRDLNDAVDRVVASMTGSERTTVTLDPD